MKIVNIKKKAEVTLEELTQAEVDYIIQNPDSLSIGQLQKKFKVGLGSMGRMCRDRASVAEDPRQFILDNISKSTNVLVRLTGKCGEYIRGIKQGVLEAKQRRLAEIKANRPTLKDKYAKHFELMYKYKDTVSLRVWMAVFNVSRPTMHNVLKMAQEVKGDFKLPSHFSYLEPMSISIKDYCELTGKTVHEVESEYVKFLKEEFKTVCLEVDSTKK